MREYKVDSEGTADTEEKKGGWGSKSEQHNKGAKRSRASLSEAERGKERQRQQMKEEKEEKENKEEGRWSAGRRRRAEGTGG